MPSLRQDGPFSTGRSGPGERGEAWGRLSELLDRVESAGPAALGDPELAELGRLYRAATTSLSQARSLGASAARVQHLNALVTRGHGALYGKTHRSQGVRLLLWAPLVFPEVVRATWPFHLAAFVLILVAGIYGYRGTMADPEWALELLPAEEQRTPYASRDELRETLLAGRPGYDEAGKETEEDEGGLLGGEKAFFASFLWRHNTRVGLLAFFLGIAAGIPTMLLDLVNGLVLGIYTAMFHRQDLAWEWWAWILPHGVTEILAIVLMSGGGLLIGYRIVNPGHDSRVAALQGIRREILYLLIFAFPMFFVAALIESFVRQSGLSDTGRYIFAAATLVFWIFYLRWGKVPESVRTRFAAERTAAERWGAPPTEQELLDALGFARASRAAVRWRRGT